jgi:uncharacterized membrane protein
MKTKHISILIGTLATLTAIYLIWPEWFGLCTAHDRGDGILVCSSPYSTSFGFPLLYLASTYFLFALIFLVTTQKTFSRWIKFSIGYAVVITGLLFAIPNIGIGAGGFGFTILDTQGFAILYAILYALISLILLAVSEFLVRRHNKTV